MQKRLKRWVSLYIERILGKLFCKLGLNISIQQINVLSLTKFELVHVSVASRIEEKLFKCQKVLCEVSLWKSLLHFRLIGRLEAEKTLLTWSKVAESPLFFNTVSVVFAIRPALLQLCFEYEGLEFLFRIRNKNRLLNIQLEALLSWSSYLHAFHENLHFDYLRYYSSKDPILLYMHMAFNKSIGSHPLFNAAIEYDSFSLKEEQLPPKYCQYRTIDKHFLLDFMAKKVNIDSSKYICYDQIPSNFLNALIATEDPHFWQHRGVDIDLLGYAISANLKSKRFERGASTITMQLVRNLFLNHDKTVLRKLEEIIVALLLENYYKIDKKDILEVYVNLIEFAPNVRGLHHASLFYFGKPYTVLTLTECIVLTYIIPRPKHFYEALLVKSEQLKKNLYSHICMYATVMKRKGLISSKEYNEISSSISFANDFGLLPLADSITTMGKREVELLVVHCTGASQNQPISHILSGWKSAGWINPGYHYLVEADGTCIQLHPESFPSNGVKGYNHISIHICYVGGVNGRGMPIDNRTLAQKHTLLAILKELVQRYPEARILGHRDLLAENSSIKKLCPSFDAKEEYYSLNL